MIAALALALFAAAQGPTSTPAAAADDAAVRARVRSLLGAIDRPVPPETWRSLGPAAEPILAEYATSKDMFPTRRSRALEGLSAFGGARAEAVHRTLAADTAAPPAVRRAALRGLARMLPASAAPDALRPYLERDRDPSVRRAAAEALAARAPAASCAAIRAQARREGEAGRIYARALQACRR